ncbi:MAG: hypothetical protein D4R57_01025 [Verrucomicrobiales bacterium]|nr:MAG: hypothetical protein D4R57_01025 [Verrucomicrobiales bacterium]
MVKAELMADIDDAVSPGGDALLKIQIATQQKWLALRYDWPFMVGEANVNLVAGTRLYTMPPTLEFAKPVKAHCNWGELWNKVQVGIDPQRDYNFLNPQLNQRFDPVARWRMFMDVSTLKFEVWPTPATATVFRFTGQIVLPALAVDADTAVLDGLLIAQFTAAKLATRMKQADAQALLAQANETLKQIRAGYPKPAVMFNYSDQDTRKPRNWQRPTVATMISTVTKENT